MKQKKYLLPGMIQQRAKEDFKNYTIFGTTKSDSSNKIVRTSIHKGSHARFMPI